MNWTATKTAKGISRGEYWVQVRYTEPNESTVEDVFRTRILAPDWPDAEVRQRLTQLNALDLTLVDMGAVKSKPSDPTPPAPSQNEIDEAQFRADYTEECTNKVLKTLTPTLAARYKPEYGALR